MIRGAVHPEDREAQAAPFSAASRRAAVEIEYRVVRPDGGSRWIYALGAADRERKAVAEAINGIHLDITDRKQAEEELD